MKKPDMLLTDIERSIFAKALVISIIAHAALLGGTSFSLFADWGKYGVHSPSYINAQKSKENKEAEAAREAAETPPRNHPSVLLYLLLYLCYYLLLL